MKKCAPLSRSRASGYPAEIFSIYTSSWRRPVQPLLAPARIGAPKTGVKYLIKFSGFDG
jgi:hypothetical protein